MRHAFRPQPSVIMKKPALLFLAAFVVSAFATLLVRTALHAPYAAPLLKSEISNLKSDGEAVAAATVVNTLCALCGMPVDPSIKPADYNGKLVGFGCPACPPIFAKEPDRYGPSALRNEVVE